MQQSEFLGVHITMTTDLSIFYKEQRPITKYTVDQFINEGDYQVGYSGRFKQPLYSAEIVTKSEATIHIKRHSCFHAEHKIPEEYREELDDYRHSGYDRGHLVCAADSDNKAEMNATFSLANMVPEVHKMNAGIWARIEGHVRDLAEDFGGVYAVTGAIYNENDKVVKNLTVPPFVYKCITIPSEKCTGVFVADNNESGAYTLHTQEEFHKLFGILPQPGSDFGLSSVIKMEK